ncbi:Transcriptional regulator, TetR family [Methylocella tundrae]|uniref:Transcriptional regulator, TetR family n=1 Tax=Methylocella tundrae TaxID=227605 RepID=A0A8B6M802_METTU|nr:helix-turn-helix domain-containing protein [Methylocella tundrae]VTZ26773.1 Transcriptional regulator, TetR family [Methylocella tundrae]VTZ51010.1 Transcriptional regulator, TetR family [Methylocella tundrae]
MIDHKEDVGKSGAGDKSAKDIKTTPKDPKDAILEALVELAGEREWNDITISDIAARANVSLSTFRDFFPAKGAILPLFFRKIDKAVLESGGDELVGEPAKERLFDVLMRRLDVLRPYKLGVEGIFDWTRGDPIAAAAVNRLTVNSMRFMLEAAGIDTEGPVGAIKLQGLALAWARILPIWFRDDDPGLATTMAALDRELTQGERLVARAEDLNRLATPLLTLTRSLFERRRPSPTRAHPMKEDADG